MIVHLRSIAQHEARQLRSIPPRLWPLVKQERDAMVLLLAHHGRIVKTTPLLEKTCDECGTKYHTRRIDSPSRFCSRRCQVRQWRVAS